MEARDDKRLLRLQRELQTVKLLIVDELGYVPLSPTGAELLFEVLSQRYERGSTIVTSNLPSEDWTSVLGPRTAHRCAARPVDPSRSHPDHERRQLPQSAGRRRAVISHDAAEQNHAIAAPDNQADIAAVDLETV
jgi:hypothetical protein